MKKTLVLLAFLLALAIGATAQEQLSFTSLPLVNSPSLMPNGYGTLNWGNFFYVNPWGWSGSGAGYKLGEEGQDVAFIGGEYCRLSGNSCYGTLTGEFELVSADVAGGYGPAAITATAYNNGAYVGTANFFVGTQRETLTFPSSWGVITEVSIQVTGATGDLVVYGLNLYTVIQNPPPQR